MSNGDNPQTAATADDVPESLCDCGERLVHELDCAYLDALLLAKIADGDVLIVGDLP